MKDISLGYALFTSPSTVVKDENYEYQNLFDAMVDATHAALEKTGETNVEIAVLESGWPSVGETATTLENARIYNSILIKHVEKGTPGRPVESYIFYLIDENQKSP
ncbi:beta-1 [Forsythia ovata]|uniref:Beta-1 n=1 Tax=Forsythia ovata TaxID=205694 RepID=A0ABD1SM34_9LAMI